MTRVVTTHGYLEKITHDIDGIGVKVAKECTNIGWKIHQVAAPTIFKHVSELMPC